MESSPALFGCFDQDYDGCVHSADVKKNVENVLQCTFLVVIFFLRLLIFSKHVKTTQTKQKNALFPSLFSGKEKVFPLPHQSFPRKYLEKTLIWTLSG